MEVSRGCYHFNNCSWRRLIRAIPSANFFLSLSTTAVGAEETNFSFESFDSIDFTNPCW